jgi:hypothetical protein
MNGQTIERYALNLFSILFQSFLDIIQGYTVELGYNVIEGT